MSRVFFSSCLVLLSLFSLSRAFAGYFPDWTNCNSDSQLQFVDFYMDHMPTSDHSINTITFCAGLGKQSTIGNINVKIVNGDSEEVMNETYPSLEGLKFTNGMFNRCFQGGILEFTQPGDYTLTLTVDSRGADSTQIACLQSTWTVTPNQLSAIVNP